MKKRLISIVLALSLMLSMGGMAAVAVPGLSAELQDGDKLTYVGLTESEQFALQTGITPFAEAACPYGIHDMVARGLGWVYEMPGYTCRIRGRAAWQCKRCYEILVSEGDPTIGYDLGLYATKAFYEETSCYGSVLEVTAGAIGTAGKTLPGYKFRNP